MLISFIYFKWIILCSCSVMVCSFRSWCFDLWGFFWFLETTASASVLIHNKLLLPYLLTSQFHWNLNTLALDTVITLHTDKIPTTTVRTALSQAEIKVGTDLGSVATVEGAWLWLPGHSLLHTSAVLKGDIKEKYILEEILPRLHESCFPTGKQSGFLTWLYRSHDSACVFRYIFRDMLAQI